VERHLHFKDEKSDKFWKIKVSGNTHTVTYGRAGSAGTSKTKSFEDNSQAQKDAEKLIKSKLKKGYIDVGATNSESSRSQGEPVELQDKAVMEYVHGQPFDVLKSAPKIVANPYDDNPKSWDDKFQEFLLVQDSQATTHFVAGLAGEAYEESNTNTVLKTLVKHKQALPNLVSLFLNDIDQHESELSWIVEGDLTPVWKNFPNLREFKVRGYPGEMGNFSMSLLERFTIECSGLRKKNLEQIFKADMPNLTHLELWVGTSDYGGETDISDWGPLLSGELFPKLKYLGLRNCDYADGLAEILKNAPILDRIETLDLSMGTLTDKGGAQLYQSEKIRALKKLDLHYHFLSDWMIGRFNGQDLPAPKPKPIDPPKKKPQKAAMPAISKQETGGFLSKLFGKKDPDPLPRAPIEDEPEAAPHIDVREPLIDYATIPLHSGDFGPDVNLNEQNMADEYDGELYYYVAVGE